MRARGPPPVPEEDKTIGPDASGIVRQQPRATYRVQLHAGFTFDDAAASVPYLASLGVSHLYCSPVLQAAEGSTHGYDVVDHSRLNDELGGSEGFARLVEALSSREMSLLLDIVPNHMAIGHRANRWWWDVLEDGPASRYACHFDIDWASSGSGPPSVLVPVLADHYGRVLEAGELRLSRRDGALVVTYGDHELPLSPRSTGDVLAAAASRAGSEELAAIARGLAGLPSDAATDPAAAEGRHRSKSALLRRLHSLTAAAPAVAAAVDAELAAIQADVDVLDALLQRQHHRLAHWRSGDQELDHRRFFTISTLAGLRVEDEAVFSDTHGLIGELLASGAVTGLRVDHVDGLRDPAGYLRRLAELQQGAYVVVEKILQQGEELPRRWQVAGSSGYDFLAIVNGVFVDTAGESAMTDLHERFVGATASYGEVVHAAKLQVIDDDLAAETERLTGLLRQICGRHRRQRDHTGRDLRTALRQVLAAMPVYRTYVVPGEEPSDTDRAHVEQALAAAAERDPSIDDELLGFLGRLLLAEVPGEAETDFAMRFQQLSAPVMAKGVEDTAFYRYDRLVSLNEVGGDPGTFGSEPEALHLHSARTAERWPATMLALSTHDTKRSADVRARINLLSELPADWASAVARWAAVNESHRTPHGPDRGTEYALYQTLVGAWPIEAGRITRSVAKAAKEAKVHTSWTRPDQRYDEGLASFVERVVHDEAFVADLERFLDEHHIVELGRRSSLSQTALHLTAPGVPDIYQGSELWDLSLVDPDNRRPVDFGHRAELLDALTGAGPREALDHLEDGGAKLWLVHRLLQHRRARPDVYASRRYASLPIRGDRARHVIAFAREGLATVAPRLLVGLANGWGDTSIELPAGRWTDVLTGETRAGGEQPVAALLDRFPVSVLEAGAT